MLRLHRRPLPLVQCYASMSAAPVLMFAAPQLGPALESSNSGDSPGTAGRLPPGAVQLWSSNTATSLPSSTCQYASPCKFVETVVVDGILHQGATTTRRVWLHMHSGCLWQIHPLLRAGSPWPSIQAHCMRVWAAQGFTHRTDSGASERRGAVPDKSIATAREAHSRCTFSSTLALTCSHSPAA